jgi:hypothetical protein
MTIILRDIDQTDNESLFPLYASTRTNEMALPDRNETQKGSYLRMQFHAHCQQYQFACPAAINQIIEFNDVPASRLIVEFSANETFLVDIALLPGFRNLGAGTSLPHSLQAVGKKIILHVIRSNPAVKPYQRLGFIFVGEEAFYSKMEWAPAALRNFPWPGLRIPIYFPATLENWSLKKAKQVAAAFGHSVQMRAGIGLPLIEQNNPVYPTAVEQGSRSYCYRTFQNDPTRAKSAQPA